MSDYDVIILGGGLSALSAGLRLARYGKRVRIFEQHARVGGMNSWYPRGSRIIDTGLHAMTNFVGPERRDAPLNLILRQLRLSRSELSLCPQSASAIRFPGNCLRLNNDFAAFAAQVAEQFPEDAAGFTALVSRIESIGYRTPPQPWQSTQAVLAGHLRSERLREMLMMPVFFYGNPQEGDMDFQAYAVMFKSVIMEGFARPQEGMKPLLTLLETRFREAGGELSLGAPITRLETAADQVTAVVERNGERHTAEEFITTLGAVETAALCQTELARETPLAQCRAGEISFIELLFELDNPPADYGFKECIEFLSVEEHFEFTPKRGTAALLLAAPSNYCGCSGNNSFRLSAMADCQEWQRLRADAAAYAAAKESVRDRCVTALAKVHPELAEACRHSRFSECYTPCTFQRWTGHANGAIYGSPDKLKDFRTGIANLHLCGTDQGLLGIVGALLSGIVIANQLLVTK